MIRPLDRDEEKSFLVYSIPCSFSSNIDRGDYPEREVLLLLYTYISVSSITVPFRSLRPRRSFAGEESVNR